MKRAPNFKTLFKQAVAALQENQDTWEGEEKSVMEEHATLMRANIRKLKRFNAILHPAAPAEEAAQ